MSMGRQAKCRAKRCLHRHPSLEKFSCLWKSCISLTWLPATLMLYAIGHCVFGHTLLWCGHCSVQNVITESIFQLLSKHPFETLHVVLYNLNYVDRLVGVSLSIPALMSWLVVVVIAVVAGAVAEVVDPPVIPYVQCTCTCICFNSLLVFSTFFHYMHAIITSQVQGIVRWVMSWKHCGPLLFSSSSKAILSSFSHAIVTIWNAGHCRSSAVKYMSQ